MGGMLADKVALVTGGGSGIGLASAIALAREGASVMIADIAGADSAAAEIAAAGGTAHAFACDVTDPEAVQALVQATVARWGRLDIALNNAGTAPRPCSTVRLDLGTWDSIIALNLTSVFYSMRSEIPAMIAAGGGAIINTASTTGLRGSPGLAVYSASKHGVIGLTRSVALEVASKNIRVNAICPGAVETPLLRATFPTEESYRQFAENTPMGRIAAPEDVAGAVLWLCSPAGAFVTGTAIPIDGALTA